MRQWTWAGYCFAVVVVLSSAVRVDAQCSASIGNVTITDPITATRAFVSVDYSMTGSDGAIFVDIDGSQVYSDGASGTHTWSNFVGPPLACFTPGSHTYTVRLTANCGASAQTSVTRFYDPRPVVHGAIAGFDQDAGTVTLSIDYSFPYISPNSGPGNRKLLARLDGADLTSYILQFGEAAQGTKVLTTGGFECKGTGTHTITFDATANCGQGIQNAVPQDATFSITQARITSLSAAPVGATGVMRATVGYAFEATHNSGERRVELYFNGSQSAVGTANPTQASGTLQFDFSTACLPAGGSYPLRAVAYACGRPNDPLFRDERQTTLSLQGQGTIHVVAHYDPVLGRIVGSTTHTFPPGVTSAKRVVGALAYRANGTIVGYQEIQSNASVGPAPSQIAFDFAPSQEARRIEVLAWLSFCSGAVHDATSVTCPSCDYPPASSSRPVSYDDGNMRYTDDDPLPRLLDSFGLQRTYDTYQRVNGSFGRGWVSMFDNGQFLHADPDGDVVSISNQNESAVFVRGGGTFTQLWPEARTAPGVLTQETSYYVYRPAGSVTAMLYRTSDGRFAGYRQPGTGRELVIAYDATGLPQSVHDSWTEVTWLITMEPVKKRVTQIDIGGLSWKYNYDAGDNLTSVVAPGNVTWRAYEYANGRMTAARDALGNLIEGHTYDGYGRAIVESGATDDLDGIEYNAAGSGPTQQITRVTMKSGAVSEYVLQPAGSSWRTVKISGGCSACGVRRGVFAYDGDGRLTREQNGSGYVSVRTYANGRLASVQEHLRPAGCDPETTDCMLDPSALPGAALMATAATITTTYEYGDPVWPDRPTAIVTPSLNAAQGSRREELVYHPLTGDVISRRTAGWTETGQTPRVVTTLYGDALGSQDPFAPAFAPGGNFLAAWLQLPQPRLRRSIDGARTDAGDVTSFVYYPVDAGVLPATLRGRLAAVRNAAGQITRFENYDLFGNATRTVDPNGVVTEMTFDDLGRPLKTTVRGIPGCVTADDALCATDLVTERTYFASVGPVASEKKPNGGVTAYNYESRGRVLTVSRGPSATDLRERIEYEYDADTGRKAVEKSLAYENGAWVEKRRESFGYDDFGQLEAIIHPGVPGSSIAYTYDAQGRVIGVRDENHAVANTEYRYDPASRLAKVTQTLGAGTIATEYGYDVHGNLKSVKDPNGNETLYQHDDLGRMTSQVSPVTGTTTYAYDDAGNLIAVVDANAVTTARVYDPLNRVVLASSQRNGSVETVAWAYDDPASGRFGIGRLTSMNDPAGATTYSYERRGLLRREDRVFAGRPESYTSMFGYDKDGNRSSMTYPSGLMVSYTHDYAGRPQTAAGGGTTFVSFADYLPFGPMRDIVYGNGTHQTMDFDPRYRLTSNRLTAPGGATLAQQLYAYDPAGNVTAIADALDSGYDRTFGYDDLNRLTSANTGLSLWGSGSFSYDAMGNILSSRIGDASEIREAYFTYAGTTPKVATVRKTNLDVPNDPPGEPGARTVRQQSVGYSTVTYDAAGNELTYVATRTYSLRNLLASVTDAGEAPGEFRRLTYGYDGRGIRVARGESQPDASGATRYYTYSPELSLLSVTRDDQLNVWGARLVTHAMLAARYDFVWFAGRPLAQLSSDFADGPHWYFNDHLGTPLLQTNAAGAVVWQAEYEPYGDVWKLRVPADSEESPAPVPDQPLRFPGQEVAMKWEGTEERYNVFRWYRAGWGRYTQGDPIGLQGGTNLYRYVDGNPLTYGDTLGLARSPRDMDCCELLRDILRLTDELLRRTREEQTIQRALLTGGLVRMNITNFIQYWRHRREYEAKQKRVGKLVREYDWQNCPPPLTNETKQWVSRAFPDDDYLWTLWRETLERQFYEGPPTPRGPVFLPPVASAPIPVFP